MTDDAEEMIRIANGRYEWEGNPLPCPLCGSQCFTTYTSTETNDGRLRIRVVTGCVCGLQFVTNTKIMTKQDMDDLMEHHYDRWNTRQVYKDMMDICVYAENIRDRTMRYSKQRE